jgi:hypothetical protein
MACLVTPAPTAQLLTHLGRSAIRVISWRDMCTVGGLYSIEGAFAPACPHLVALRGSLTIRFYDGSQLSVAIIVLAADPFSCRFCSDGAPVFTGPGLADLIIPPDEPPQEEDLDLANLKETLQHLHDDEATVQFNAEGGFRFVPSKKKKKRKSS